MRNSKLGLTVVLLLFSAALIAGCQAAPAALGADAETKQSSEVELLGLVREIGDEAWIVGEQSLAIAPETEIKGLIVPGDFVKVHALLSLDGSLQAREIEVQDPRPADLRPELEFVGLVETISTNLWTVGGKAVAVTAQTEIKGLLVVGDRVKVHAFLAADGSLTAREIELAEDEEAQDDRAGEETEFEGIIESMTPTLWMIGGKSVVVTEQTELEGQLNIGDEVQVEGFLAADGSLVAREIKAVEALGDANGQGDQDDDAEDDDGEDDEQSGSGQDDSDDDDDDEDQSGSGQDDSDDDDDDDEDQSGSGQDDSDDDDDDNRGGPGSGDDDAEDEDD